MKLEQECDFEYEPYSDEILDTCSECDCNPCECSTLKCLDCGYKFSELDLEENDGCCPNCGEEYQEIMDE